MHICMYILYIYILIYTYMSAMSSKILQTLKLLPKISFNMDIKNRCLLPCFCILFKRWVANVTKVLLSEVVLANLEISEPIDA